MISLAGVKQHYRQPPHTNNPTQHNQTVSTPSAPPIIMLSGEQDSSRSNPDSERAEYRQEQDLISQRQMASGTIWIAVFTVLMTLITFAGVVLVGRTLKASRDGLKVMEETRDAANSTVEVTREIGQKQAMAYVHAIGAYIPKRGPTESRASDILSGNIRTRLVVQFENFGSTIARNIIVRFHVDDPIKDFKYREIEYSNERTFRNIAPGQKPVFEIIQDLPKAFKLEEVPSEDANKTTLRILRGEVVYDDVFGNTFRTAFIFAGILPLGIKDGLSSDIPFSNEGTNLPSFEQVKSAQNED